MRRVKEPRMAFKCFFKETAVYQLWEFSQKNTHIQGVAQDNMLGGDGKEGCHSMVSRVQNISLLRTKIKLFRNRPKSQYFNRVAKTKNSMIGFPWVELAENW